MGKIKQKGKILARTTVITHICHDLIIYFHCELTDEQASDIRNFLSGYCAINVTVLVCDYVTCLRRI